MLQKSLITTAAHYLFRGGKYLIDRWWREKVQPVPGSVLYSDLYAVAEHSGIYDNNRQIVNLVVDDFWDGDAWVESSPPDEFTDTGIGEMIYVSCNAKGKAVGRKQVADYARSQTGTPVGYSVFKNNCHHFTEKCVRQHKGKRGNSSFLDKVFDTGLDHSVRQLKASAKEKLGAEKWLLWDWQNQQEDEDNAPSEAEKQRQTLARFEQIKAALMEIPLNAQSIQQVAQAQMELEAYQQEIADEPVPQNIKDSLQEQQDLLADMQQSYQQAKTFIEVAGLGEGLTLKQLRQMPTDSLQKIAQELQANRNIENILRVLGREYISREKKKSAFRQAPKEVFSIHKSNAIPRLLPSELILLEDEHLELLFYAKMMEHNLLCYQLGGAEKYQKSGQDASKGPIVALLDTSGSMSGKPLLQAKALLFAINRILNKEKRHLHVLLFGGPGQVIELHLKPGNNGTELLHFLQQGFDGGTHFETPLNKAIEIIESSEVFEFADVLMISDGLCTLSDEYLARLREHKTRLGFSLYTIICGDEEHQADRFSDEVFALE